MADSVCVLAGAGVNPFELAVAGEIFGTKRHSISPDWYEYKVCGPDAEAVSLPGGLTLMLSHDLAPVGEADTVIVPAYFNPSRDYDERILAALRSAHSNGARIVSLCTGSFLLAAAGLLDGRRATTHWQHADRLQQWYRTIDVAPDLLYVDDGDILTSAGSSAAIDLSLHVVACDYGSAAAAALARRLVLAPHRDGGQRQFVINPPPEPSTGQPVSTAMRWALIHLDEQIRVADLARIATTSERSFIRHFDATVGMSPMRWLRRQRVERAKELLETTNLAVPFVASAVGLGSPANFRTHFARHVGISPSRYRQAFRLDRPSDEVPIDG